MVHLVAVAVAVDQEKEALQVLPVQLVLPEQQVLLAHKVLWGLKDLLVLMGEMV
jgi:hypothetical protein